MTQLAEEKQGYLGDLQRMSTEELMELLSRQERILRKEKFLSTLPDKGKKVMHFAEKLQNIIHNRQEQTSSDDNMVYQQKSDVVKKFMITGKVASNFKINSMKKEQFTSKAEKQIPSHPHTDQDHVQALNNGHKEQLPVVHVDIVETHPDQRASECQSDKTFIGLAHIEKDKSVAVNNIQSDNLSIQDCERLNCESLEKSFQKLNIGAVDALKQIETEKTTNAYAKACQKSTEFPMHFKPNSTLKMKSVKDLPDKYKFKSKGQKNTEDERDKNQSSSSTNQQLFEESAATPRLYKNDPARLISLADSLELQRQQKSKLEVLQARCAAERLAQRLNITMEKYNPEGVDMSYRNKDEDIDSDDEECEDHS